jgi:hypothetical protein
MKLLVVEVPETPTWLYRVPFTHSCSFVSPTALLAVTATLTVPETVLPLAGEVMSAAGGGGSTTSRVRVAEEFRPSTPVALTVIE